MIKQHIFPLLFFNCCRIRDPGWKRSRSGIEHSGFATLGSAIKAHLSEEEILSQTCVSSSSMVRSISFSVKYTHHLAWTSSSRNRFLKLNKQIRACCTRGRIRPFKKLHFLKALQESTVIVTVPYCTYRCQKSRTMRINGTGDWKQSKKLF